MAFRNNNDSKKVYKDKKCINYYKLGHFEYDYSQPNRRLAKIEGLNIKRCTDNKSRLQTSHQVK